MSAVAIGMMVTRDLVSWDVSQRQSGIRLSGSAAIWLAATLWGLWPIWVRYGGGDFAALAAFTVAAVLGLPFALHEGKGRSRPPSAWALLALLGLLDGANALAYFRALGTGATAPAVLGHYLAPVLIAISAPWVLREPRGRRVPAALFLAAIGTACVVLFRPSGGGEFALSGFLWGATSALFYAGNVLTARAISRHFGNFELFSFHAVIAALLLLLFLWPLPSVGLTTVTWAVSGGVISCLVAGALYYSGLRKLTADRAAVLSYWEPVCAVFIGWIVFSDRLTVGAIVGGALVISGGIYCATEIPATGREIDASQVRRTSK